MPTRAHSESSLRSSDSRRLRSTAILAAGLLVLVLALPNSAGTSGVAQHAGDPPPGEPLRIGLLLDYTGPLGAFGPPTEAGVRLAVEQINRAGGVLGRPVEVLAGDGRTDPEAAVAEARRLVDDGAQVLVGPMGSAAALEVARRVSGPRRVPTVTPSATAPELSQVDDDDYLFRTALSDLAQGPALAHVARRQGAERVAVAFQDDPYGRGLFEAFRSSFGGELAASAALEPEADSYEEVIRRLAGGGARTLLVAAYPRATEIVVREALDRGAFDRFLFVDANMGVDVVRGLGAERLEGMLGTRPAAYGDELPGYGIVVAQLTESTGSAPSAGTPLPAFDATVCLALATEHAGTTGGEAIRDSLRAVCGPGDGETFHAGSEGVTRALAALRDGRAVNYEGASSPIDWDRNGDVGRGVVGVYRFTDGAPLLVDQVPYTGIPTPEG